MEGQGGVREVSGGRDCGGGSGGDGSGDGGEAGGGAGEVIGGGWVFFRKYTTEQVL